MKNLGMILLSVWLVATGLLSILGIGFPGSGTILALLAIAAGVVIFLGLRGGKVSRNLGMFLLGIWLVATGLLFLLNLSSPSSGTILAALAVAAGVLILVKR